MIKEYRMKFDGRYVKEADYEYLVECEKEESVFSETFAQAMKQQQPNRIEIEVIEDAKKTNL